MTTKAKGVRAPGEWVNPCNMPNGWQVLVYWKERLAPNANRKYWDLNAVEHTFKEAINRALYVGRTYKEARKIVVRKGTPCSCDWCTEQ